MLNYRNSLNEISLSNTPWTRKLVYKRRKARDSRIEMSKQFDCSKHSRMVYIVKKYAYKYAKLGVVVRFRSSSSINGSDVKQECELMFLSHGCSIGNEVLRFHHVAV